jgi:hypothetical protein
MELLIPRKAEYWRTELGEIGLSQTQFLIKLLVHHFGKASLIYQNSFNIIIPDMKCYDKRVIVR